jgi:DNA-binding LytR/AlgR family response regulator
MSVRALVADDEPALNDYLIARLAALWPALEVVAVAANGEQALDMLREFKPDVAFLDIKMPGLSGIEVVRQMGDLACRIVFVTAYDQFAVDAFDEHAVDYLLKPVSDERLGRTIERLKAQVSPQISVDLLQRLVNSLNGEGSAIQQVRSRLRWLRVAVHDTVQQVSVDDVLYFKAADKYTIVVARGQNAGREMLVRMSLAELLEELDPEVFWQVHRGCIVNLRHVALTRRDVLGKLYVRFKEHAAEVAVSRQFAHRFRQM